MNTNTQPAAAPATAPALLHRHGGTITAVTHIGHDTQAGVAYWFYIGDIEWNDGTTSKGREIDPICLCHDDTAESRAAVLELNALLTDYLVEAGQWHEPKHKRDGRVVRWTPTAKSGRKAVQS